MLSGTGPRLAVRSRVKSTEPANKIECETRSQRRTRHPPPVGHRKRLHWAGMVMLSRDDDVVHLQRSRTRPPSNHIAYNPTRQAARKDSLRLKRKASAWHDDSLVSHVAA
jgi:hypothetical protein